MNTFRSIKGRLLLFALCISLIPIVIITTIYYFHARSTLKYQILEKLRAIAESREQHVLFCMDEMAARVKDFSSDGFIKTSLETISRVGPSKKNVINSLNRHLSVNKMPLNHCLRAVTVVDKYGRVVASTNEKLIGEDLSGQDVFTQAICKSRGETYIGQPGYLPDLDANCILVSAPLVSRKGDETFGVIINANILDALNKITTNRVGMGETGEVYLVNRDRIMLTKSRFINNAPFKKVVDTEPVLKILAGGKEMVGIYPDYRGIPVVGASMYLDKYGWILLAEIDKAEVFMPLKKVGIAVLILGAVCAAAVIGVGTHFAISTSRPIKHLTNVTERFAAGNLEYRARVIRKDEIGSLASSFNTMAEGLAKKNDEQKQLIESLRKSEKSLANAQRIAHLGNWDWNMITNELHWSDEIYRIFGLAPQSFNETYEAFLDYVHPHDREFVKKSVHEAIYGRKPYSIDHRIILPDSTLRIVHEEAEVIFDSDGKAIQMNGTVQDITERKRAGEEINLLLTMTMAIAEAESFHSVLDIVLRKVCESTGWIYGEVWLPSPDGTHLKCSRVWHDNSEKLEVFRKKSVEFNFSPGNGVPGLVWESKRPEWRQDFQNHEKFPRAPFIREAGFKASMGIPVIANDEVIAVLNFFVREQREEDERLVRLVSSVAIQLGSLIQRMRMEEELKALNESLEQRVADRTKTLIETNQKLQAEIIERKQLEEEHRKLSNAIEQSPATVVITDIKGNIEYVNPKFCRTTGYTPEEAVGQNPRILKSGEIPPEGYKHLWDTITSGKEWRGEFHNKRKNGELYWEFASISPIRNAEGVITHFLAVKEDITARKRMEAEIESAAKFPAENPYPVLRTTPDGTILYANPSSTAVLSDWNCKVGHFLPDSLCQLVKEAFRDRLMKKGIEIMYRDRTFSFTILPVAGTDYVNLYGADITERKRAEEELRKQRDHLEYLTSQLTASNKELEAFCYSVSHDLRAPLRSVDGFSRALMEDYADKLDTQGKDYLHRMSAASRRMGQLIDDLLNLSRITRSEMHFRKIDLSELAGSAVTKLQELEPERLVEFSITKGLVVRGDSHLLQIALENLLNNAWKFTRKCPVAKIEFGVTHQSGKPVYFVRDNGVGFDMTYSNKLFGAFQRLHSTTEFEGTGIGLATVQRIIHRHGGRIWAEGAVGKGATFSFTI